MKKKLLKFIKSKGGIWALVGTIVLLLVAAFLVIVGVIYSDYGGNWNKITELLTSNFAITTYVVLGLVIFALIYIYVIFKRKEELK